MKKIKLVIPKGRLLARIAELLNESSIGFFPNDREYVPHLGDSEIETKIMKPQNIAQLIELGSHDVGFTGWDWVIETEAKVVKLMDLKFNPVKVVAAIPDDLTEDHIRKKRIVVASEYERISRQYLQEQKLNYILLRSFGATEAFPPQDADMIIDNISSGQTLKTNKLKIIAEILSSTTCFIANEQVLNDPWKREKIDELKMLFKAVLNAKDRVMLEMNVPEEKLDVVVGNLPCMRAPTVSALYSGEGYAVKAAVKKTAIAKLIPALKRLGATDILEYDFRKVML